MKIIFGNSDGCSICTVMVGDSFMSIHYCIVFGKNIIISCIYISILSSLLSFLL